MSNKNNEDLQMIDLDRTGTLLPEEKLPKEVTMDTQLLTDVSAEISLSMEDTQPLVNIKALAAEAAKQEISEGELSGETRVISPSEAQALKKKALSKERGAGCTGAEAANEKALSKERGAGRTGAESVNEKALSKERGAGRTGAEAANEKALSKERGAGRTGAEAADEEELYGENGDLAQSGEKEEVPEDTMVILDLDKTSELSGLLEDITLGNGGHIQPARPGKYGTDPDTAYGNENYAAEPDAEYADGDYEADPETAGDYESDPDAAYENENYAANPDAAYADEDYEADPEAAGDYESDPDAVYEAENNSGAAVLYKDEDDGLDVGIDKATGLYLVPDEDDEDEDDSGEDTDELTEEGEYADTEDSEYADGEESEYADSEEGEYADTEDSDYADGEEGDYADTEDSEYADGEDSDYADGEAGGYIDSEGTEDSDYADTEEGEYADGEDSDYADSEAGGYVDSEGIEDSEYSDTDESEYADTEDGELANAGEDAADIGEAEDPRLFETGEIMSLEEGRDRKDNAVAPSIRKNPVNMIVLVAAAVCFLLLCVFIGVQSYKNRSVAENKPYMYDVGERLAGIGISGQSGLMAMANAGHAAAVPDEDPDPDDENGNADEIISVKLNFTSVAKDIKLKFINTETERLIMDIPFEVVLTPTSGEQLRLVDEDMDGIIYKKDVAGGDYKLAVLDQEGCDFVSIPTSVKVKDSISYQKIDVKEEIKKENEVNAAVEDTGNAKEPEEGPPPTPTPASGDTVEWVESTKTPKEGSDGYKLVDAGDIPEPDYSEVSTSKAGDNTAAAIPVSTASATDNANAGNTTAAAIPVSTASAASDANTTEETRASIASSTGNTAVATTESIAAACEPCGGATTKNSASITTGAGRTISASEDPTSTPTPIPVKPDETPTPTPTPEDEPTPGPDETPTPKPTGDDPSGSPTPTDKDGKKDPKKDKTTKLKDKNGNQLYIKNGDKYEEAVYADYYKAESFYILGEVEYIYTGWQTLDGKTYFFDKNGNKVTGDQIIKGVKYHFDENGVLIQENAGGNSGGNNGGKGILGIDVSKWNGSIDWNAVKASGVNFVIIRCGYRGSSTGVLVEDPTFRTNIQGAQAAGIKVGLYFFTQAVNEVEAVEEASMCLSLAQGYNISYPIFIDVEFTVNKNGRADGLDRATRSAVARAFCETINNGGYAGGVYSSKSWYGYSLDMSVIGGYKIWLAHYTSQTDYSGHYDIWQYSSKGSISGIKGNVDMNYSYMGY